MTVLCVVQERDNKSWGMVLAVERSKHKDSSSTLEE